MKKIFLFVFAGAALCVMSPSSALAADRDALISQSLDCMQRFHDAGAVTARDICAMDSAQPGARRSSVKVTTEPIVVQTQADGESGPQVTDEPMDYEQPIDIDPLAGSSEGSWSYEYFNFIDNPLNSLEAGFEVFDYTYREEGFMKLDGSMAGVYGVYTHHFHENEPVGSWKEVFSGVDRLNFIRLDSRYSRGTDIKYRSEGTGESENETHFAYETRLVAGADYPVSGTPVTVSPYVGLGYRYLKDDNGGGRTSTGNWSYDRESEYVYIPLGVDVARSFNSGWKAVANLEYDFFVDGTQKSHLEDDPNGIYTETLVNDQNQGYGCRGSVKFIKEMTAVNVVFEPFTRYWHIKASEGACTSDTCGIEPNNRTWEFGVKAGIQF